MKSYLFIEKMFLTHRRGSVDLDEPNLLVGIEHDIIPKP